MTAHIVSWLDRIVFGEGGGSGAAARLYGGRIAFMCCSVCRDPRRCRHPPPPGKSMRFLPLLGAGRINSIPPLLGDCSALLLCTLPALVMRCPQSLTCQDRRSRTCFHSHDIHHHHCCTTCHISIDNLRPWRYPVLGHACIEHGT